MSAARDALRQVEADAYNPPGSVDPFARSDFRRGEILDLNAAAVEEARSRQTALWSLLGFCGVVLFGVFNHRRSR